MNVLPLLPLILRRIPLISSSFSFNDPSATEIYTLSLHDALPICFRQKQMGLPLRQRQSRGPRRHAQPPRRQRRRLGRDGDRKSTRLNSSHVSISYAVFCLKKKKRDTSPDMFVVGTTKMAYADDDE